METQKDLVSVIIPCYNGEKVIHRLLDSLLSQTYTKLEIIFINDGSTDGTENVVNKYIPLFTNKDIAFKYTYQINKGLGGAMNTGLKQITGEFFIWPDADDFLTHDSVEKRITLLKNNPEVPLVTSNAYISNETNPTMPLRLIVDEKEDLATNNLFESYLCNGKGAVYCSGTHMMRTKMFIIANGSLNIYEAKKGQNWQLLLPVLYKYKNRIWLNEPCYYYVIYKNSMSRTIANSRENLLTQIDYEFPLLFAHTFTNFLSKEEKLSYLHRITKRFIVEKSIIYILDRNYYKLIKHIFSNANSISFIEHLKRIASNNHYKYF